MVLHRYKYLQQKKDGTGAYTTHIVKNKKSYPFVFMNDRLKEHIAGKETYGVFANNYGDTPFMFFDFDFKHSWTECKQYYYRVREAVIECGIPAEHIHASHSGNKGVHLEIFFGTATPVHYKKAQAFYHYVLHVAGLTDKSSVIEFRPTKTQGAKMPIGVHQLTGNRMTYLDPINLDKPLDDMYFTTIETLPTGLFDDVLERLEDTYGKIPTSATKTATMPAKSTTVQDEQEILAQAQEQLFSRTKLLEIYGLGEDEDYTAEYYNRVLTEGLKAQGTRHKVTYQLALYLKTAYGMDKETAQETLLQWLQAQPTNVYTTPLPDAIKDTCEIVKDIYLKGYVLRLAQRELTVSIAELQVILTAKNAKGKDFTPKQKTVLFAMLMHAKRYANKKGTFFMTYEQIKEATGMANRARLKALIEEFAEVGLVNVHRSNATQEGTYKKLANVYEVLFAVNENTATNSTEDATSSTATNNGTSTVTDITGETFTALVQEHFTAKELRKMLPRKQAQAYTA